MPIAESIKGKMKMMKLISRMAITAILFFEIAPTFAAMITLQPSYPTAPLGSTFDIDIVASDVTLGGFQLEIGFNPALVSAQSFTFGSSMGFSFNDGVIGLDTVSLDEVSFSDSAELLDLQKSPFVLGKMTFKAISPGSASFNFAFNFLTDPDANQLDATFIGADVTIPRPDPHPPTEIPELSTWIYILIGTALCLRRLQKRMAFSCSGIKSVCAQ